MKVSARLDLVERPGSLRDGKSVRTAINKIVVLAFALHILAGRTLTAGFVSDQQGTCMNHRIAVDQLKSTYGEKMSGCGLANQGQSMIELLVSETGSWTSVMTDVQGCSGIMAIGEAWPEFEQKGQITS
jgi:hypothetical protein